VGFSWPEYGISTKSIPSLDLLGTRHRRRRPKMICVNRSRHYGCCPCTKPLIKIIIPLSVQCHSVFLMPNTNYHSTLVCALAKPNVVSAASCHVQGTSRQTPLASLLPHATHTFDNLVMFCRALIAPNVHDGSPRVLVEALSVTTSILVNKHIVGGWKYVQPETGEFFSTGEDIVDAWDRLMEPSRHALLQPRQWFM
jgi:hypothetical protein